MESRCFDWLTKFMTLHPHTWTTKEAHTVSRYFVWKNSLFRDQVVVIIQILNWRVYLFYKLSKCFEVILILN